jgi:hypothetical protein
MCDRILKFLCTVLVELRSRRSYIACVYHAYFLDPGTVQTYGKRFIMITTFHSILPKEVLCYNTKDVSHPCNISL